MVGVDCAGLKALFESAKKVGTVWEWCDLAIHWSEQANEELMRQKRRIQELETLSGEPEARRDCYGAELTPISQSDGALYAAASEPAKRDLTPERLHAAWVRYCHLFGTPPHGSLNQIEALLTLLPDDQPETKVGSP
jgi:hypothetical protein